MIDLTAKMNDWLDVEGVVLEIDGLNIKVRHKGGGVRWKIHNNFRKVGCCDN